MDADHDEKHATKDEYGNVTADNQNGVNAKGKPWKFGDSLAEVKPDKIETPAQLEARLTAFELDEKT